MSKKSSGGGDHSDDELINDSSDLGISGYILLKSRVRNSVTTTCRSETNNYYFTQLLLLEIVNHTLKLQKQS